MENVKSGVFAQSGVPNPANTSERLTSGGFTVVLIKVSLQVL